MVDCNEYMTFLLYGFLFFFALGIFGYFVRNETKVFLVAGPTGLFYLGVIYAIDKTAGVIPC